jgi:hypothetical protein
LSHRPVAEDGTKDTWWILKGKDYPRLWREAAEERGYTLMVKSLGGYTRNSNIETRNNPEE